MKRAYVWAGALVVGLAACGGADEQPAHEPMEEAAPAAAEPEWTVLLDGTSLDGWTTIGDNNWHPDPSDGSMMADAGDGRIVSVGTYDDLELSAEFWVDSVANSGVFIRAADPTKIDQFNSYEVNIFDNRPDQTYRTGSLVEFAPPAQMVNTVGQWNTIDIKAHGPHIWVNLNGIETVHIVDSTYTSGHIALQRQAGVVKFRNVRVRELEGGM